MPPTSTALYNTRTYSKKGISKRKHLEESFTLIEDDEQGADQLSKRRKLSPEADTKADPNEDDANDYFTTGRPAFKSKVSEPLYKSAPRLKKSLSALATTQTKQSSNSRQFSQLLEGALPSVPPTSSSSSSSSKKLAKRMLARSKTDTSVSERWEPTEPSMMERTPSLPSLPYRSTTRNSTPPLQSPAEDETQHEHDSQETHVSSFLRPKATRTYAGASRSFLIALPRTSSASQALLASAGSNIAEEADFGITEEEEELRESYADLRSRWGVDNSEDDPYPAPLPSPKGSPNSREASPGNRKYKKGGKNKLPSLLPPALPLPNGMMNPLKSITELRSKGESRRFLDEVGYLFEGMDIRNKQSSISLRRASALEITTKLCDLDFARKAKTADFLTKTWDVFCAAGAGRGDDLILDTLMVFFVALVSRDQSSLYDLAQRQPIPLVSDDSETIPIIPTPANASSKKSKKKRKEQQTLLSPQLPQQGSLIDILFSLLGRRADFLRVVEEAVTKNIQGVRDVEAGFWSTGITRKDHAMILAIHSTISQSRLFFSFTELNNPLLIIRTIHSLPPSLLHPKYFPTLLSSLEIEMLNLDVIGPISGLNFSAIGNIDRYLPSLENIQMYLELLDSFLLSRWGTQPLGGEDPSEIEKWEQESADKLNEAKDDWLVTALVGFGVRMEACLRRLKRFGSYRSGVTRLTSRCLETSLRILVSLTHGKEAWCDAFLEQEDFTPWLLRIISGVLKDKEIAREEKELGMVKRELDDEVDLWDDPVESEAKPKADVIEVDDEDDEEADAMSPQDEAAQSLDRLCLALGVLTNLVQVVEKTKTTLQDTRLSISCSMRRRTCLRVCTCPEGLSALGILVRLYAHHLPSSSFPSPPKQNGRLSDSHCATHLLSPVPWAQDNEKDEDDEEVTAAAEASFLCGHLAILFGLLMQGSTEMEKAILQSLPNPSPPSPHGRPASASKTSRAKLQTEASRKIGTLVEQANEFIEFYESVGKLSGAGTGAGSNPIAAGHGASSGDGKVVRGVVMFLESLRDGKR